MKHLNLVVVTILLTLTAACGGSSDETSAAPPQGSTAASSPAAPATSSSDLPPCEDIWEEGKTLYGAYTGCTPSGDEADLGVKPCDSGAATYAGYHGQDTEMFAILGQEIVDENSTDMTSYDKFYADCFTD